MPGHVTSIKSTMGIAGAETQHLRAILRRRASAKLMPIIPLARVEGSCEFRGEGIVEAQGPAKSLLRRSHPAQRSDESWPALSPRAPWTGQHAHPMTSKVLSRFKPFSDVWASSGLTPILPTPALAAITRSAAATGRRVVWSYAQPAVKLTECHRQDATTFAFT